jgi:PAS domain S-box-containing protein
MFFLIDKFKNLNLDHHWYFTTLESIEDGVIATDRDGKITFLNSAAESITGWNFKEAKGLELENVFQIINEESREKVENPVAEVIATGNVVGLVEHTILINKDGKEIPIEDSGAPIENEEEDVLGVLLVFRDISERKKEVDLEKNFKINLTQTVRQRTKELEESEEKYSNLFQHSNDGIFLHDLEGNIIDANQKVLEQFGYDKSEILTLKIPHLHPISELEKSKKAFNEIAEKGFVRFEINFKKKNGEIFPAEVSSSLFSIGEKKFTQGVVRDITTRKQSESNLKESEEKYREAYNRAQFYKDLFAHDINNILQNVQSSTDTLMLAKKKNEGKEIFDEMLKTLKTQVNRGSQLVSNVRRLSDIEDAEFNLKQIDAINFVENAIKFVNESYKEKNLKIECNSENNEFTVKANELILDVFENILINAIKYNDNQNIVILIKISKEKKEGKQFVKFEFRDNGIGIQDERKLKIFQRTDRNSVGGMGLGLSLVYHIIMKYNGFIWVENKVKDDYSKGSNFILLIPEVK